MAIREFAGAARRTTLVGDVTAASTTFTVADATGYPTGAAGPFAIAFDMGVAGEEKVLVGSRTGNTLTVAASGRGYDGTTATSHTSGSNVDHVLTAIDVREANTHINATVAAHAATAIGFTPAAGVAATTVQAAIEEVVSDSSAAYVAKVSATALQGPAPSGDVTGATDRAALQAAIDAAATNIYTHHLVLQAGVYYAHSLVYKNSLHISGQPGATTIRVPTNQLTSILAGTIGVIGSTGEPVTDLVLSDLTLDGNQQNNTAGTTGAALLHAYSAKRLRCYRVRFLNSVGYGCGLQGFPSSPDAEKQGPHEEVLFDSCEFTANGYYQGTINTSADGLDVKSSTRLTMVDCHATGNSDKGFNIRGRYVTLIRCSANSNSNGFDLNSNEDTTATGAVDSYFSLFGCSADSNAATGIAITATTNSITHATVVGCYAEKNGSGLATNAPLGVSQVRLSVIGGHYNRNTGRGIGITTANEVTLSGVSCRLNGSDGVRFTDQAGARVTDVESTGNTGFGLRFLNTCTDIEVSGGNYNSNTAGTVSGSGGLRLPRNVRGFLTTANSADILSVGFHNRPVVTINGTTTITSITATYAGDVVTLLFASTAQVTDGLNLKLAGNFTGGADRTLTLVCNGTNWIETARSTN